MQTTYYTIIYGRSQVWVKFIPGEKYSKKVVLTIKTESKYAASISATSFAGTDIPDDAEIITEEIFMKKFDEIEDRILKSIEL